MLKQAIADGTHAIFLFAAAVTVAGFVVSWFIKQVPLRDSNSMPEPTADRGRRGDRVPDHVSVLPPSSLEHQLRERNPVRGSNR